jgi:tetratricopeptide (TPR) repeat protein
MSTESESHPRIQRAQALFKTGNDAALKNNLDYAISMYQDACKLAPENLLYRQALRGVERRKFGNDPAKVGRFIGARLQTIRLRSRTAKAKGQWAHVFEVCEEAFVHNPWDVSASVDMAEAAEKLGLNELARWALESVYHQAGNDAEFFRHQAHVYELNNDWQKAISCWERVRELAPTDENAKRQINYLSANATIARSGLNEAIHKTPSGTAGPESLTPDAEELKRAKMSPEERWRQEIDEDPERIGTYLDWAESLKLQNRLDEAEKILSMGLRANQQDSILKAAHAEIQIARLNRAIEAWEKRVNAHPDDMEAQAKLGQLGEKRDAYEMKEFRRRLDERPDDTNLRLQIGIRLARSGQLDAAIAEFQQARSSPSTKVEALFQLGQAFESKGLPKLGERSYQEALAAADQEDQSLLNSLHYHLGRVAEAQGNLKVAEEHYNEVAANDFSYKDVAQRLTNLNPRPPS